MECARRIRTIIVKQYFILIRVHYSFEINDLSRGRHFLTLSTLGTLLRCQDRHIYRTKTTVDNPAPAKGHAARRGKRLRCFDELVRLSCRGCKDLFVIWMLSIGSFGSFLVFSFFFNFFHELCTNIVLLISVYFQLR